MSRRTAIREREAPALNISAPHLADVLDAAKRHLKTADRSLSNTSVALFIRMMDTLIALDSGNQLLEAHYLRAKSENAILHRLLAALIRQNGGCLVLDERTWQETDGGQRIGARRDGNDSAFVLEEDRVLMSPVPALLGKMLGGQWLKDIHANLPTIRELAGKEEPQYLPIFNAVTYAAEGSVMATVPGRRLVSKPSPSADRPDDKANQKAEPEPQYEGQDHRGGRKALMARGSNKAAQTSPPTITENNTRSTKSTAPILAAVKAVA